MKHILMILMAGVLLTGCSNAVELESQLAEANTEIERIQVENADLEARLAASDAALERVQTEKSDLELQRDTLKESQGQLETDCEALRQDYEALLEEESGAGSRALIAKLSVNLLGQPVDTVLDVLGEDYEDVAVSVEGSSHGYLYEDYGIIAARYKPISADQEIYGIYLTEDNTYFGTAIGMTLDEVIGIMGPAEKISVMTEGQEYWMFYDEGDYAVEYRALENETIISISLRVKDTTYDFYMER